MKPYPSYKDSGVEWIGEIPKHWNIERLKFSNEKGIGGIWGNEPNSDENDLVCLRVSDFDYERLSVKTDNLTLRNIPLNDNSIKNLLKNGDLLLEKSGGGEISPVGRIVIYENEVEGECVCSNFIQLLHLNLEKFHQRFLVYYHSKLYSEKVNTRHIKQTTGIQNLDVSSYMNEKIGFPPPSEQQKIVSYLDRKTQLIDELIEKTEKKIELLKEKRTSLINHCVTKGLDPNVKMKDSGVEWIGEIPSHWEVKRLKYMSSVQFSSVDRHIHDDEITVNVCHYPDVYYNEKITSNTKLNIGSCSEQEYEKYRLKNGDVIITKDSESPDDIGVPTFVEENLDDIVCGYHLSLISTLKSELLGEFLFRYIQSYKVSRYFEVHSNGITRFGLGKYVIENLFVPFLNLSEQQEIIDFLDNETKEIDTLIEMKNKRIDLLKEYRQSLISEAVTGKIDVRDEVVV